MELISQRIAKGLPIKPKRRKRKSHVGSQDDFTGSSSQRDDSNTARERSSTEDSLDWEKWGERVDKTKAWAGQVKSALKDGNWKSADSWRSLNPLNPVHTLTGGEKYVETHSRCPYLIAY